jgi:coenzyme F420-0:L-glutamate ligase/coenzyme F420-1:gamma-L-glutamate ligase
VSVPDPPADTGAAVSPLRLIPLPGIPAIRPGDDLAPLLRGAADRAGVRLDQGVLVVCQKIISKAEGRLVDLGSVEPSESARQIATEDDKDPRHVEVVLRETARIVRRGHGVLICETHHGFVCANAGVDLSNATAPDVAVLLPADPDASAARLRDALTEGENQNLAVIITDTFGRPWRQGLVDQAIGCAGLSPIADIRGCRDLEGRELLVTTTATADQLAAAAGLLMVKNAGIPAVWVAGLPPQGEGRVSDTLRDPTTDLFR